MQEQKIDMNMYCTDDYPREGCTLVIRFIHKGWELTEFAPGFPVDVHFPGIGKEGWIASYASRPLGSLGLALDAYAAGKTIKSVLPEMVEAERAYALVVESCGSAVTL